MPLLNYICHPLVNSHEHCVLEIAYTLLYIQNRNREKQGRWFYGKNGKTEPEMETVEL